MAGPVLIKRYANRRLYDTGRSRYITLDDLADDLAEGRHVKVVDAKSGEDLTQRTILQVLLTDRHVHKLDFLPEEFLRVLLQIEDQSLMRLFSHYLKTTLSSFALAQQTMQQNLEMLRTMAPGPADLMRAFTGFMASPKKTSQKKTSPKSEEDE